MQNDYYIVVSKAFFGNKNKAAPPLLFTGKEANLNCRKLSKGRFVVRTGRTIVTVSANMPGLFLHSKEDQRVFYSQAEVIYEKLKDHSECRFVSQEDTRCVPHKGDAEAVREWLRKKELIKM